MNTFVKGIPDRLQLITQRLRKWFVFSLIIGLITGALVALLDFIVTKMLDFSFSKSLSTSIGAFLLPLLGLTLAGLVMTYLAKSSEYGVEEVVKKYHDPEGSMNIKSTPAKLLASILTVGFGGSAGLEGPSFQIGAAIGTLFNKAFKFINLDSKSVKTMMIAGSAAGIAAVFKAPLTGVIFGLEVPYKDDLARDALIPSLIASVSSYMVFVAFMGVKPLFKIEKIYAISYWDLLLAAAIGLLVGIAGRFFVRAFRWAERTFETATLPKTLKFTLGGAIVGLTGLISIWLIGSPASLGIGYGAIGKIIAETFTIKILFGILILKFVATIATLASGGVGGVFIPMIMLGATIGSILGKIAPFERGHLYPIIGMSSFLAAGYKTPLAAVTFIAETTGSPGYIIPGLIAAAVGYIISGRMSVSKNQHWVRSTKLELMLSSHVSQVMTTSNIVMVPKDIYLEELFLNYILKYRYKSMPVVDNGKLFGMISLIDIKQYDADDWGKITVGDAATKDVHVAYRNQTLAEVLDRMNAYNVDRMPVVSNKDPREIIGIISSTDIVALEELSKFWRDRTTR